MPIKSLVYIACEGVFSPILSMSTKLVNSHVVEVCVTQRFRKVIVTSQIKEVPMPKNNVNIGIIVMCLTCKCIVYFRVIDHITSNDLNIYLLYFQK